MMTSLLSYRNEWLLDDRCSLFWLGFSSMSIIGLLNAKRSKKQIHIDLIFPRMLVLRVFSYVLFCLSMFHPKVSLHECILVSFLLFVINWPVNYMEKNNRSNPHTVLWRNGRMNTGADLCLAELLHWWRRGFISVINVTNRMRIFINRDFDFYLKGWVTQWRIQKNKLKR